MKNRMRIKITEKMSICTIREENVNAKINVMHLWTIEVDIFETINKVGSGTYIIHNYANDKIDFPP